MAERRSEITELVRNGLPVHHMPRPGIAAEADAAAVRGDKADGLLLLGEQASQHGVGIAPLPIRFPMVESVGTHSVRCCAMRSSTLSER